MKKPKSKGKVSRDGTTYKYKYKDSDTDQIHDTDKRAHLIVKDSLLQIANSILHD